MATCQKTFDLNFMQSRKWGQWEVVGEGVKCSSFVCKCSCGRTVQEISSYGLRKGESTKCRRCAHGDEWPSDLTGMKFGRLTVIGPKKSCGGGAFQWFCRCDCKLKTEKWVRAGNLLYGHSTSCGCFQREGMSKRTSKTFGEITGQLFSRIRKRAMRKGIVFDVTIQDLQRLLEEQNYSCAYTNRVLTPENMSLDRVNNDHSIGYTNGNMEWMVHPINIMKHTLTKERFIKLACCVTDMRLGLSEPLIQQPIKPSRSKWGKMTETAKRNKKPFEISFERVMEMLESQGFRCSLTGLPIFFSGGLREYGSASLDRIDSLVGHVEGNLQWVHRDVNIMKWHFSTERIVTICSEIASVCGYMVDYVPRSCLR